MNANNITLENITGMLNLTTGQPAEFFINVNEQVFGGWFYFILLWIMGIILFRLAQSKQDQPLINGMYVMASLTILSFFLRAISIVIDGMVFSLVDDYQMWIFPLVTAILAAIVKYMSDE